MAGFGFTDSVYNFVLLSQLVAKATHHDEEDDDNSRFQSYSRSPSCEADGKHETRRMNLEWATVVEFFTFDAITYILTTEYALHHGRSKPRSNHNRNRLSFHGDSAG